MARRGRSRPKIRDRDRGYDRLLKAARKRGSLLVGVQGEEALESYREDDQVTVAQVAQWAEFGIGQPERSWLRAWVDENRRQIQIDLRKASQAVLRGRVTWEVAVGRLGAKYVAEIQERIANGIDPPNAPSTIARKGSSTPLIDTGQLRSAITYTLEIEAKRSGLLRDVL